MVPTAPCTPQKGSPIVDHSSTRRRFNREQRIRFPFPIVLPPIDYIARLPLSAETSAKMRLQRLVEREEVTRQRDGLWASNVTSGVQELAAETSVSIENDTDDETEDEEEIDSRSIWDSVMGLGASLRCDIVDWILNVRSPGNIFSISQLICFRCFPSLCARPSAGLPRCLPTLRLPPQARLCLPLTPSQLCLQISALLLQTCWIN